MKLFGSKGSSAQKDSAYVPPSVPQDGVNKQIETQSDSSDDDMLVIDSPGRKKKASKTTVVESAAGSEEYGKEQKTKKSKWTRRPKITATSPDEASGVPPPSFATENFAQTKMLAEEGPKALRPIFFVAGCFMMATSVLDWVHGMFYFSPTHALVAIYTFCFGFVTCLLEGEHVLGNDWMVWQRNLHKHINLFRFVWGRGAFYFFAGSLQFSHMEPLLNMISGGIMMSLGLPSFILGLRTVKKLKLLRESLSDDSGLKQTFDIYDTNGDGYLEPASFSALLKSVGVMLTGDEIVAEFDKMDSDNDKLISFPEFETWWTGFKFDSFNGLAVLV
uniref:EF-hand domain-containing protein n=1 Tax=Attheya septentrionalis TaxID=420275 RepID=A0A7S2UFW0_9STRA|mmetsp:Transcript_2100/g.3789  ORF Transcript_2100/g.3789 Transcript_2100/m.3789 type:complete len:332 (+) Transcript_2100:178-1173(+)|eukprot:CAMPEP_0198295358 /NCGR_PEP_ID=MMETSP1449-20131203/27345_1 /TAXON_ID=420275 /ORGANISM="Attheya septentrionalis, Strain CCMP2084" /LENGTH=331 /DNA_ID=CAMNT_0043995643 /DNA_START=134 /DNA_END=1129 /DNA_ORIENTATION=-